VVAYPIVALADGEVLDPNWIQDVTDAANDHQTRVSVLEGIDLTPVWTQWGATASPGGTTAETVIATAPSTTYRAHTAYRIEISGFGRRTVGTGSIGMSLAVRDTNAAGTVRMGALTYTASDTANTPIQLFHYIANATGSDILGRVLVVTIVTTAGTAVLNASAQKPWYATCIAVGLDTDFPQGVAL
jgi:hypothetical protein